MIVSKVSNFFKKTIQNFLKMDKVSTFILIYTHVGNSTYRDTYIGTNTRKKVGHLAAAFSGVYATEVLL